MSRYDKSYEVRRQESIRFQADQNVRYRRSLDQWDQISSKELEEEYLKLLKKVKNKWR